MTLPLSVLRPAVEPEAVGLPCWPGEGVARAVSRIAQLDAARSHLFLASHTPIRNVRDDRTGQALGEEALFRSLVSPSHGEVLALVHGDPGTGKSHLIHWLKLRLDRALEAGEVCGVIPVLVRRRTGSLRDALEQLVEQLPPEFEGHLDTVRRALERISVETARQALAGQLRLELGPRRADRGREPLRGGWRDLPEVAASQGFRNWLSREGGPIDRCIRRLNEASELEERQSLEVFSPGDFRIGDAQYRRNNVGSIEDLIDAFDDEPEARERAAALFNEVLPDALREVTGLTGSTLREVFDRIRSDLAASGRQLAVFIEDVSVMSSLDREVVNAFEPQAREDLCRVVAVVGLTESGMTNLPQNLKERATHAVSVGEGIARSWQDAPEEIARFTARYLNTLRLADRDVREIADRRRQGSDIPASACDGCAVRERCHEVFGAVELDGDVAVGMFPFTPSAPHRLLDHLEEQAGVRRNPRGLLMHIVQPVVADREALADREFPSMRLPVRLPALAFWGAFEERYCAGWAPQQRTRLQLLAGGWVQSRDAESAAGELQPLLAPLGLPDFSRGATVAARGLTPLLRHQAQEESPETDATSTVNPQLQQLLDSLAAWMAGGKLERDRPARDLLARMIRESVPWGDQTGVPLAERARVLDGYVFVSIEEMRAIPRQGGFTLWFDRSGETRDLLQALAHFEWAGKRSWNFQYGELYKRVVARWLRRHTAQVMEALDPQDGRLRRGAIQSAVQFLALSAMARRRARLPDRADRTLDTLFAEAGEELSGISPYWKRWLAEFRASQGKVKAFLLEELSVPQGAGGINFIDPLPVFDALKGFERAPSLDHPPEECFTGFSAPRFAPIQGLANLPELAGVGRLERAAVDDMAVGVRGILAAAGYGKEDAEAEMRSFFADLAELVATQRGVLAHTLSTGVDDLAPRALPEAAQRWGRSLSEALRVGRGTDSLDPLLFDPAPLEDARRRLEAVLKYLNAVEKLAADELAHIERDGDPDRLAETLLTELGAMVTVQEPEVVEAV